MSALQKPSVLILNRVYPPVRGSTGRLARDLARGFVQDGWDVTVITTGAQKARERDGMIRVYRVKSLGRPSHILSYLMIWLKLFWTAWRLGKQDLFVTMTDPPLLVVAGSWLAKWRKVSHIHWCQDVYPDLLPVLGYKTPKWLRRYFTKLARKAMKRADKIVVIGRCMAKYLTHHGIDKARLSFVPNWPDQELISPDSRPMGKATSQSTQQNSAGFAAPSHPSHEEQSKSGKALFADNIPKFRILCAGNVGRAHPLQTILKAAHALQKSRPEIEFVFVGEGSAFNALVRERDRLSLENMRFLPYQPLSRLKELMEGGDLHLITMPQSASGMLVPSKLYSALAVGRPSLFIGPKESETARTIEEFKAGYVIEQGDVKGVLAAIESCLDSDVWFRYRDGAEKAGAVYRPAPSIQAWVSRARQVVGLPDKTESA